MTCRHSLSPYVACQNCSRAAKRRTLGIRCQTCSRPTKRIECERCEIKAELAAGYIPQNVEALS